MDFPVKQTAPKSFAKLFQIYLFQNLQEYLQPLLLKNSLSSFFHPPYQLSPLSSCPAIAEPALNSTNAKQWWFRPQATAEWTSWGESSWTDARCRMWCAKGLWSWPITESDPVTFPANCVSRTAVSRKSSPDTTRQEASKPAWLADRNPKWPRLPSSTQLPTTRGRIRQCSPGRYATACSPKASVHRTMSPAYHPLTGA